MGNDISLISSFLNVFTFVGSGMFYIMLFPLIFWCIDKSIGKRVLTLSALVFYINMILKNVWMSPRPNGSLDSFSRPSGYVMGATSLWGYFFTLTKQYKYRFISILVIIFTGLSRFVLGYNYFIDILFALFFTVIILILFKIFEPKITNTCNETYTLLQRVFLVFFTTGAAIVLMVLTGSQSTTELIVVISYFFGGTLGIILEKEHLGFSVNGSIVIRIGRYILGTIILALVFYGLQFIFTLLNFSHSLFQFILYSLIAFISTYPIPKLFVYLNFSETKSFRHL